jgi:putative membrane protein
MEDTLQAEKKYNKWIIALSIIIPVAVAALFGVNLPKLGVDVAPMYFLPPIYAAINGLTAVILVVAVQAIKNSNQTLHERLVKVAIGLSVAFLVMYVAYHMTTPTAIFGDADFNGILDDAEKAATGSMRYLYYFILFTHIPLSVVIIPFVLITYVRGITGNYERHRKIARITYPLWLYVAVTGVIVYAMISPYYPA